MRGSRDPASRAVPYRPNGFGPPVHRQARCASQLARESPRSFRNHDKLDLGTRNKANRFLRVELIDKAGAKA